MTWWPWPRQRPRWWLEGRDLLALRRQALQTTAPKMCTTAPRHAPCSATARSAARTTTLPNTTTSTRTCRSAAQLAAPGLWRPPQLSLTHRGTSSASWRASRRPEGGRLPFRSCFRSSSAAVPQQLRSSSAAAPQQLRSSSAAAPQQLRSSSAAAPQQLRSSSAVVPCYLRSRSVLCITLPPQHRRNARITTVIGWSHTAEGCG